GTRPRFRATHRAPRRLRAGLQRESSMARYWLRGGKSAEPSAAALQVLVEPRHDLDEVAWHVAVVELRLEDAVPGVAAGAGRARQHEDEGRVDDAARRSGLDCRDADLVEGDAVEDGRKSVHAFLENRLQRVGRHVAAGEA